MSLGVSEVLLLQHYDVMLAPAPNDIMLALSCTLGVDMRKRELHVDRCRDKANDDRPSRSGGAEVYV